MTSGSKTFARRLLGAAFGLWVPLACAGEITVYPHRDFHGEAYTLNRSTADLPKSSFHDSAASVVVRSGIWEVCTGPVFSGICKRLDPGEYSQIGSALNSRIASLREVVNAVAVEPPPTLAVAEPRIGLFGRPGFSGEALELSRTTARLDWIPSYAGAAAVIVYSGTWRLCSEAYYRGDCSDFSPGRYDDLGAFGEHIASAQLISTTADPVGVATPPAPGGRVVLYEFPDFGGRSLVIEGRELASLGELAFDNRAASLRVESGNWMFCTDVDFRGNCRTLGPGEYPRLPRDVDRKIGSARRIDDVYGAAGTIEPH